MSSILDFSEAGRLMIEGPPFMMFLGEVSAAVHVHIVSISYEVDRISLVILAATAWFEA